MASFDPTKEYVGDWRFYEFLTEVRVEPYSPQTEANELEPVDAFAVREAPATRGSGGSPVVTPDSDVVWLLPVEPLNGHEVTVFSRLAERREGVDEKLWTRWEVQAVSRDVTNVFYRCACRRLPVV